MPPPAGRCRRHARLLRSTKRAARAPPQRPRPTRLPAHGRTASPPPLSAERPRPLREPGGGSPEVSPYHSAPKQDPRRSQPPPCKIGPFRRPEQPWHCNQGRRRPAPGLRAEHRWANMAGAASATSRGGGAGRPRQGTEGESAGPGGVERG